MIKKVSYTDNGKCDNAIPLYTVTTRMALIEYDVSIGSSGGFGSKQREQHQQFRLVLLPKKSTANHISMYEVQQKRARTFCHHI